MAPIAQPSVCGLAALVLALALVVLGVAALAARAEAAPRVRAMVVGQRGVLFEPRAVTARAAVLRASGRRCRVGAGTPLAVLAAADRAGGPSFRTRDEGSCSRRARDASGLFVFRVGRERNRGLAGWVYKVDRRLGTTGAGDPTGPFATGRRLRAGQRVSWFWCRLSRAGGCQRTLELVGAPPRATAGQAFALRVRAFDDGGRAGSPPRGRR